VTGPVRIQKALSAAGVMSRRAAEEAIAQGRVTVDGSTAVLGDRVDPVGQLLALDGIPVTLDPTVETWLLYKPVGVVSTVKDTHGRTTVVDLVESDKRLYPVGRLDMDSEGLILISNDGELTQRVTHPSHGITKTYLARVQGKVKRGEINRLVEGVELDDGPARAMRARTVATEGGESLVELVMVEGRNREVRRMLEAVGHPVVRLVRTAIGPITDRNLAPGDSRRLTVAETRALLTSGGNH
jgi:23S rRNA pseudouridine2605 synthase